MSLTCCPPWDPNPDQALGLFQVVTTVEVSYRGHKKCFSSTPPDIRVSREARNDTYEMEGENAAVPSWLMLQVALDNDSSIKLDISGWSENERIRNKKTNMIHKLKTTLTTAEGDMKERLENAISKLEEEVKQLNDVIASSLLDECLVD